MPSLSDILADLPADQRSARKAAWHLADVRPRIRGAGYTFTDGDLEVTVTAASASGAALTLTLTATQDGVELPLVQEIRFPRLPPWDDMIVYRPCNPFIFTNPPVGLWTPGGVDETINGAFKSMVAAAVRGVI